MELLPKSHSLSRCVEEAGQGLCPESMLGNSVPLSSLHLPPQSGISRSQNVHYREGLRHRKWLSSVICQMTLRKNAQKLKHLSGNVEAKGRVGSGARGLGRGSFLWNHMHAFPKVSCSVWGHLVQSSLTPTSKPLLSMLPHLLPPLSRPQCRLNPESLQQQSFLLRQGRMQE
jgi:hypothetical protein